MTKMSKTTLWVWIAAFLIFFLGTFIPAKLYGETVELNTPFEESISLNVPENYEDLKDLTIMIAELYWGERHDLEQSQEQVDTLIEEIDNQLIPVIDELRIQNKDLITLLDERIAPTFLQSVVSIGTGMKPEIYGYVSYGVTIFELITLRVAVGYPLIFSADIGITF